jgi:hypothetical protein
MRQRRKQQQQWRQPKKKGKDAAAIELETTTHEEAKRNAERQNNTNQTIVGTKESIIKVLNRNVGTTILDAITKTPDASRDRSIDDYTLFKLMQHAIDNTTCPEVDDVLENMLEVYQFEFDFRKTVKHNMATLKTSATCLKPFGITIAEPELTLILLANIHQAKDHEWGQEFRTAMSAKKNTNTATCTLQKQ